MRKTLFITLMLSFILTAANTSFAYQFEANIADHEAFAKALHNSKTDAFDKNNAANTKQQHLTPNQGDKVFVEKNKKKYKFLDKEEILDISQEKFDNEVKKGNTEDPNAIHHKDLNAVSTAKSLNQTKGADKAGVSTGEYFDIATKTREVSRKYKKDLEEKPITELMQSVRDPAKVLKERFQIDLGCTEEEQDKEALQQSLSPQIEKYMTKVKTKKTEEEHKTCEEAEPVPFQCQRKLTPVCARTKECDDGGIVVGSIKQPDMLFQYNYPELTIGTIADNYWAGNCTIYDRTTSFKIRNLKKIKEFRIAQVGFDDYLWIKVNGHTVYVGPFGGNQIDLTSGGWFTGVTTNGKDFRGCELGTNWNVGVNIDIRPYLKDDGENEIWTRVIVAGVGEGWMKIIARQDCCDHWEDVWEDQCEKDLRGFK